MKIGSDGKESLTTTATGPMTQARWYSTGVALPDGTVAAFSGATADDVDKAFRLQRLEDRPHGTIGTLHAVADRHERDPGLARGRRRLR